MRMRTTRSRIRVGIAGFFFLIGLVRAPLALGEGPPHHHLPPISGVRAAGMMPSSIASFNTAAQLAATNLMDLSAREALQAQANSLAQQYSQLQSQAKSGGYDTSGMPSLMNGFSNDVGNAQMQNTHPEDTATTTSETSDSNSVTTVVERPVTVQVIDAAAKPAAPPDPSVARPDEQIIPNISAAFVGDSARSALPALPSTEGAASVASRGIAEAGTPASSLAVMIAAAGDPRTVDILSASSDSAPGASRHSGVDKNAVAAVSDSSALDSAGTAVAARTGETPNGEGAGEAKDSNNLVLPGAASVSHESGEPKMPAGLVASVNRVQGGDSADEGKKSGWFSELKHALLGPRFSSFFAPLDLRGGHTPSRLGEDSPDLWWKVLIAPFAFTLLLSGAVWFHHARENRRWLRQMVVRASTREKAAPPVPGAGGFGKPKTHV